MKPTSVIFLIISVLLACVGVLLMVTATDMAESEGISIFSQTGDEDSNYITEYEIDDENTKKIILSLTNVDVKIIGNAKVSKIELINFTEGAYDYTEGKTSVNLTEGTSITNIIDIDNFKINFNGFRDYLNYFKYKDKQKSVNIYLSSDCSVNVLNLSTEGDVTVDSIDLNLDYRIKVEEGNVTISDITTDSSLVIDSSKDSNINLDSVEVNDLEINGVSAFVNLTRVNFSRSLYIKVADGGVDYDAATDFEGYKVLFRADAGVIDYLGNRIINGKYESDTREDKGTEETGSSSIASSAIDSSAVVDSSATESETNTIESNTVTITVVDGDIKVY